MNMVDLRWDEESRGPVFDSGGALETVTNLEAARQSMKIFIRDNANIRRLIQSEPRERPLLLLQFMEELEAGHRQLAPGSLNVELKGRNLTVRGLIKDIDPLPIPFLMTLAV